MGSRTAWDVSGSSTRARRRASLPKRPAASRWRSFVTVCLSTLLLVATWAALATTYHYDPNGRLTAVTNDAGESARYRYDVLGNLTEIERLAANELAIFSFSPGRGGAGVAVHIHGHGFSPTAAQNVVRFNGVAASVSTATISALTAIVPAGATTGPISVTVGSQTATSTATFIIDENALPPAITNVSPLVASIGTAITVNGQHLAPVANQTALRLNHRPVLQTTLTNVQAVFPVPIDTGSGRVSVMTPYGTAVSNQDVLVIPNGVLPGEIAQIKRLILDAAAQGFSVATTGHYGAALFDASVGESLSAQFSSMSVASIDYTLYSTRNTVMASGTVSSINPTFHLPRLPAAGTYLLLMKPVTGPATWNVAIERDKELGVDGTEHTAANIRSKRYIFKATHGQKLGSGLSEFTSSEGGWGYAYVYVHRPDGGQLTYETCYQNYGGCDLDFTNLAAGTYQVTVVPSGGTVSFKAALSADVTTILALEAPYPLSLSRPGQNGRLKFNGTAGQTLALNMSAVITSPADNYVSYTVYKPDGSVLQSVDTASGVTLNLPQLPMTGTYTVALDPYYAATLSAQTVLLPGLGSTITTTTTPGDYATAAEDQNVYFSFTATAGQNLALGLSEFTSSIESWGHAQVRVYYPDGSQLAYEDCYQNYGGCDVDLPNLSAGTYQVIVDPSGGTIGFKAALSADVTTTLAPGTPYALLLNRPGQNGRLKFNGTVGQTVALSLSGAATMPADSNVSYTVYKPDGSMLRSQEAGANATLNLTQLPVAGTYTVMVDPYYAATLSAQAVLLPGLTSTITPTTAVGNYTTTAAGQNVYFSFTATAGQNLALGLTELTSSEGEWTRSLVSVYYPDGSQLAYASCYPYYGGCDIDLPNLSAGTYRVAVAPDAGTMTFKAALSADVTTTLTPSTPYALSLNRPGQNGRLKFNGTAGQTVALNLSGVTTVPADQPVSYTVFKPDGSVLQSVETVAGVTLNLAQLPAAGIYTVLVDPSYAATLSAQAVLLAGLTSTITSIGAPGTYTTTAEGQNVYFSFTATAGQNLALGLSELTSSEGEWGRARVSVYYPDGSQLGYVDCYPYFVGCDIDMPNLGAGTYRVTVAPDAGTMTFKAALSTEVTTTLASGTPYTLSLNRPGQNGRLKFNGSIGQTVELSLSGAATVPVGQYVYYTVYKPDGGILESTATTTDMTMSLPSLPLDGTYSLLIDPDVASTLTAQAMQSGASGTPSNPPGNQDPVIVAGGTPSHHATTASGESFYLSFTATAGQNLGLGLSDLVNSDSEWTSTFIYVYRPDGSQLAYAHCYPYYGGCELNLPNLIAGTHRVMVSAGSGTMSFTAALSADVTTTLASGTAYAMALSRPGQNGRLTFNGTAGQVVALKIAGQVTAPADQPVYYTVFKPDGSVLQSANASGDALTLNMDRLPVSGTYTMLVDPSYAATANAQVTLLPGVTAALTTSGALANYATTAVGQNVYLSFTATAGQNLGLGLRDLTSSNNDWIYVLVHRPDGTQLTYASCHPLYGGCELNLSNLMAGSYRVVVTPTSGTMSFTAALSADVTTTLASGTAYAMTLGRPGQNGRLKFTGTIGQTVALKIAGLTTMPAAQAVYFTVYKPDGSILQSASTAGDSLTINLTSLPVSGTYTMLVDPSYAATANAQVTLLPGVTATLTSTGAPASYGTTAVGQNVYLSFTATAGQNLGLALSDLDASDDNWIYVYIYRPDGNQLSYISCLESYGSCELNLPNLMAGTYRVVISPTFGTMNFTAALSSDVTATLIPGTEYDLILNRPGQNGRLAFAAETGGLLRVKAEGLATLPAARPVTFILYKPDGSVLQTSSFTADGIFVAATAPADGTYTLFLDPAYGATVTGQVTLQ